MENQNATENQFGKGIVAGLLIATMLFVVGGLIVGTIRKTHSAPGQSVATGNIITTVDSEPEPLIKTSPDTPFTIKGASAVKTEIDGEEHHFVVYKVEVSDFWLSQDEEKAAKIGAEEEFKSFFKPDGELCYYSTYFEQLNDGKGIKVTKEFMDCGTDDNKFMLIGAETPLYIEFCPSTGYFTGIADDYDKGHIPTVTFN